MERSNNCIVEGLCRYIGRTVTIFTTSGGLSGEPNVVRVHKKY